MSELNQLFIGGDLSGIQKFIYNISSKKAAVSLKGRSYYLKQYMEGVCERIIESVNKSGATKTDTIYCSGGKFYIITDNSEKITSAINLCYEQLKKELWEEHMGQLGLNIAYTPFNEQPNGSIDVDDGKNQKPGILWKIVNEKFAKQKNQKFKELISNDFQNFFNPILVGGNINVCAITGIESPNCVKLDNDGDDMFVLPSVKKQIELGEDLRNKQHFKTFEDYADETYLGILRMDVDGLGKRFIEGFASIAEYKVFSNNLVKFFEEEVPNFQKEQGFTTHLNIIYAGGDDLFVVGRWDKVIDFAERIQLETKKRFQKEGISISGGIAIVNAKFPIAKAAEMAGEAEDNAKHYNNGEKNAFHFLGNSVSWNKEFDYVKDYQQRFCKIISQNALSKGILHKIMLYASIAKNNKKRIAEGKTPDYSYKWHLCYYLARYKKRYSGNAIVQNFCNELNAQLASNDRNLEKMALSARWAELLLKQS
mgnify:CR=1 FL=1